MAGNLKKKKENRNSETISLTLVIHFYEFCNTLQSRPDISHTPTDPQRVSFPLVLLETLERSFLSSFTLAPFLLISLSSCIRTPAPSRVFFSLSVRATVP